MRYNNNLHHSSCFFFFLSAFLSHSLSLCLSLFFVYLLCLSLSLTLSHSLSHFLSLTLTPTFSLYFKCFIFLDSSIFINPKLCFKTRSKNTCIYAYIKFVMMKFLKTDYLGLSSSYPHSYLTPLCIMT